MWGTDSPEDADASSFSVEFPEEKNVETFATAAVSTAGEASQVFSTSDEDLYLQILANSTVANVFTHLSACLTLASVIILVVTFCLCMKLRHFMPLRCRQVKWLLVSHVGAIVMQVFNIASIYYDPVFLSDGIVCTLLGDFGPYVGFSIFISALIIRSYNKFFTLKKLRDPPINPLVLFFLLIAPFIGLGGATLIEPLVFPGLDRVLLASNCLSAGVTSLIVIILSALVIIYYFVWIYFVYRLRKIREIFNEAREMSIAAIFTISATTVWLVALGLWFYFLNTLAGGTLMEAASDSSSSPSSLSSVISLSSLIDVDSSYREYVYNTLGWSYGMSILLYAISNTGTVTVTLILAIATPLKTYFSHKRQSTGDFSETLEDESARLLFRQYAQARFAIENVDFYELATRRKKIAIPEQRDKIARFLIRRFIVRGAKDEINIGNSVRDAILNAKDFSDEELFDKAIGEISNLIRRDLEGGFRTTREFQELETQRSHMKKESETIYNYL